MLEVVFKLGSCRNAEKKNKANYSIIQYPPTFIEK